ncbi:Suppressor of forked protein (Suf) domain containing protein [Rhypophila sp. PSN 637]
MADYDPEHQEGAWEDNEEYEDTDDDQQEDSQHSSDQDQADYSLDRPSHAPGDFPSADGTTDDVGDYDPASVTSAPVPEPVSQVIENNRAIRKPSPQPAKKPKTAGGFLVGDSDSEEEDDSDSDSESAAESSGLVAGVTSQTTVVAHSPPRPSTIAPGSVEAASNSHHAPQMNAAVTTATERLGNTSVAGSSAPTDLSSSMRQAAHDRIASYEARTRDDPRGAMDAWLALIKEHRSKNDVEASRQVYDRFLAIFPQAADIWAAYLDMELGLNNFPEAEQIFGKCLMGTPNVNLWTKYLDYIRRRNDLNDMTGQARQTVSQAYEFVIDNIGLDKDSGKIWAEYIQFLKSGPGVVGGSQWQDQQKMDQLRKAYQRAICVPIANVNTLWKEYDQFEMGLNKTTGRKYLNDKSPSYMSAKSANTALDRITRNLHRSNLPRLPPAPGFDGDQEYLEQVESRKEWIAWEKSDPLDLANEKDQGGVLQKRILYAYNQALMALRFWPEMWVDAAQWCIDNNITTVENKITKDGNKNGLEFLTRGIEANPESVLLALKHADLIETTYPIEESDEAKIARGKAVRAPYSKVLDTLYGIVKTLKDQEASAVARVEESFAKLVEQSREDEDDDRESDQKSRKEIQIKAIQQGYAAQTQLLSRTISFVWIALIRAMRRVQGKGKPGTELGGMRQAFMDARQAGRLTSDVYAEVAKLEWVIYKEPAGGKIFDRGAKLFPEDENFTLEYIKYLHSRDDFTNARVLFETVVNRLTQKPETAHKAKILYSYIHKYESQFGELAQIAKLEKRMAELYPEDPKLLLFSSRFSTDKFDPIKARIVVSPTTQLKPKLLMPSIEQGLSRQNSPRPPPFVNQNSPRPQFLQATNSPKRPLPIDDFDEVNSQPRKIQRGEHNEFQRGVSPLKGAAGRRLDQQRRMQGGGASYTAAPAPIARDITFLLSQIPRAEFFDTQRLNPNRMVALLRDTAVPDFETYRRREEGGGSAFRGGPTQAHNRQVSADYNHQYGLQSRDSPAPHGRPLSPYTAEGAARGRVTSGSATYRQSSLRPGSSGSYEPPPAAYGQQGASQPQYSHGAPPVDNGAWAAYGAPPPQGYAAAPPPLGYSQGGLPPQSGYPRYPY